MISNKKTIQISTEKSGFNVDSTERSRELVKRVYHAIKRKNGFYNFTRCFHPMRGLTPYEENRAVYKKFYEGEAIHIGDVKYIPNPQGHSLSGSKKKFIPNILAELNMISSMLRTVWRDTLHLYEDEYADYRRSVADNKATVLEFYTEYYLSSRNRDKKVKPTNLMVEFVFGIFGTCLATIMFFALLFMASKMVALMFCFFIFTLATIALCILWD